jgi:VWFA-related protein
MPAWSLLLAFLLAQTPTFTEPPVYVTAIELMTEVQDAKGNVPPDLKPEDFIVLEDGREMRVIGVDYSSEPAVAAPVPAAEPALAASVAPSRPEWQILIYFDLTLTSPQHRNLMVDVLAKQAEDLTRLGSVEIVMATPARSVVLEASRDPEAIRAALKTISKRGTANAISANRRQFLHEQDMMADVSGQGPGSTLARSQRPEQITPFLMQEVSLANRFRRNLFEWLSHYPRRSRRALFVISDGFELDPTAFYVQNIRDLTTALQLQSASMNGGLSVVNGQTAELLAAAGWVTIGVPASAGTGGDWTDDASRTAIGRVHTFVENDKKAGKMELAFLAKDASASLQQYAVATGGSVINAAHFGQAIDSLARRVTITYQVARSPDGRARRVEVRSTRPGLRVKSTQ